MIFPPVDAWFWCWLVGVVLIGAVRVTSKPLNSKSRIEYARRLDCVRNGCERPCSEVYEDLGDDLVVGQGAVTHDEPVLEWDHITVGGERHWTVWVRRAVLTIEGDWEDVR